MASTTLQIWDVPDDVYAIVRARAALEGKTVSGYLLELITGIARQPTPAEVAERIKARTSATTVDLAGDDILAALHEGKKYQWS